MIGWFCIEHFAARTLFSIPPEFYAEGVSRYPKRAVSKGKLNGFKEESVQTRNSVVLLKRSHGKMDSPIAKSDMS